MKNYLKHIYYHYSLMQVEDFLKMIYQSEFGCEHFQSAADTEMLKQEYSLCSKEPCALYDEISFELCRLNLAACAEKNVPVRSVSKIVLASKKTSGCLDNLEAKCSYFLSLVSNKSINLPYFSTKKAVTEFVANPVHYRHSTTYRKNYNPHYRVVKTELAALLPLLIEIDRVFDNNMPCFLALDGRSASGKSKVATILKEYYNDCYVFHADDFFLTEEKRKALNKSEANIDLDALQKCIDNSRKGEAFEYTCFDCKTDSFYTKSYEPKRLVVVEGVYAAHAQFRNLFDIICYLQVTKPLQYTRLEKRNPTLFERFEKEWLPREEYYFAEKKAELSLSLTPYIVEDNL